MAPGLAHEKTLKAELPNLKAKITVAGNEVFGAWRDGETDDLILSIAMPCWLGENTAIGWDGTVRSDARDGRPGDSLISGRHFIPELVDTSLHDLASGPRLPSFSLFRILLAIS